MEEQRKLSQQSSYATKLSESRATQVGRVKLPSPLRTAGIGLFIAVEKFLALSYNQLINHWFSIKFIKLHKIWKAEL
jgi:phosphatidylserine decarboxylase